MYNLHSQFLAHYLNVCLYYRYNIIFLSFKRHDAVIHFLDHINRLTTA